MEFTEKVLIVSTGRFREADLWVRFISPTRGLLTAFAFGGCKSRKRFCGCLDVLNQVRFRVKSDRAGRYLSLMEGSLVAAPERLRNDWERFGMAMNCVRFFELVNQGMEREHGAYSVLVDSLESLDTLEQVSAFFPVLFRARLLKELGIAPDTDRCDGCGKELGCHAGPDSCAYLLVDRGRFVCASCAGSGTGDMRLGDASFSLLKDMHLHEPGAWEGLLPQLDDRREFSRAVERFTRYHLGVAWDRGRFRRI